MEVTGLPAAVKVATEALLEESELSSRKIAAEGKSTVAGL